MFLVVKISIDFSSSIQSIRKLFPIHCKFHSFHFIFLSRVCLPSNQLYNYITFSSFLPPAWACSIFQFNKTCTTKFVKMSHIITKQHKTLLLSLFFSYCFFFSLQARISNFCIFPSFHNIFLFLVLSLTLLFVFSLFSFTFPK